MLNDSCRAHALTEREAVPLQHSKYELFNPIQLGLKATAATWPPQWREMIQGFVSAFPSMAGCVQGPGVNLFSGCSRLGSLGRENR